ncbi:MAG: hypothetical protein B7Z37_02955 [Verrucomicrobia bacterium 12-59-8]|nr:MAG: hypothetical protein B7Z37_02955 [Verrucomicrobia bacterium 12-59-8]
MITIILTNLEGKPILVNPATVIHSAPLNINIPNVSKQGAVLFASTGTFTAQIQVQETAEEIQKKIREEMRYL